MSDGGSNRHYNQPQRSTQPQHLQQPPPQQPRQHTAAGQQMGGYIMHQQPAWGGGGVQQAQYAQQQQTIYQQQLYQQHMRQQQSADYGSAAAASGGGILPQYQQTHLAIGPQGAYMSQQQQALPHPQPMQLLQPRPGRLPENRPIVKLSVGLIETYKEINKVSREIDTFVCLFVCYVC